MLSNCLIHLKALCHMLEISPRPQIKKELINRNDHVIKLFKCDLLIFSLSQILDRFLASWTLTQTYTKSSLCTLQLEQNVYAIWLRSVSDRVRLRLRSKSPYKCFEAFHGPITRKNFTNWPIKKLQSVCSIALTVP